MWQVCDLGRRELLPVQRCVSEDNLYLHMHICSP